MYACVSREFLVSAEARRGCQKPWTWNWQVVVNYHVMGGGNQILVLLKSSKCCD